MDRETIVSFIKRYKFHDCLWNISNPNYTCREKRLNALQDMVPILGEGATIDTVRKRIDILRNGYNRELKKVMASTNEDTSPEDVYTPTLWYYDLMSFIYDDVCKIKQKQATRFNDTRIKRIKRRMSESDDESLDTSKKSMINESQVSDDNMFGLYIGRQLQDVTMDQRIFAEKLMSDILYFARTNQLNDTSQITTRPPSQTDILYNESPSPEMLSPKTDISDS